MNEQKREGLNLLRQPMAMGCLLWMAIVVVSGCAAERTLIGSKELGVTLKRSAPKEVEAYRRQDQEFVGSIRQEGKALLLSAGEKPLLRYEQHRIVSTEETYDLTPAWGGIWEIGLEVVMGGTWLMGLSNTKEGEEWQAWAIGLPIVLTIMSPAIVQQIRAIGTETEVREKYIDLEPAYEHGQERPLPAGSTINAYFGVLGVESVPHLKQAYLVARKSGLLEVDGCSLALQTDKNGQARLELEEIPRHCFMGTALFVRPEDDNERGTALALWNLGETEAGRAVRSEYETRRRTLEEEWASKPVCPTKSDLGKESFPQLGLEVPARCLARKDAEEKASYDAILTTALTLWPSVADVQKKLTESYGWTLSDMNKCEEGQYGEELVRCLDKVYANFQKAMESLSADPQSLRAFEAVLVHQTLLHPQLLDFNMGWLGKKAPDWTKNEALPKAIQKGLASVLSQKQAYRKATEKCAKDSGACGCAEAAADAAEGLAGAVKEFNRGNFESAGSWQALVERAQERLQGCSKAELTRGAPLYKAVGRTSAALSKAVNDLPTKPWRKIGEFLAK